MSFFRIAIAPPDSRFHGGRKSRRRIGRPGPIDIILPAATHYARRGPPVRDFCISQEQDAPGDGSVVLQFRPRSRDRFIKLEAPCRTLSYRNEVRISPPEDAVEKYPSIASLDLSDGVFQFSRRSSSNSMEI